LLRQGAAAYAAGSSEYISNGDDAL
jgi:hypothetical protein